MAAAPGDTTRAGVVLAQRARVTGSRGEVYDLREVTVWRDSVIGWMGDREAPERAGLPLAEVRSVERRKANAFGTTLIVVGMTAVIFTVLAAAAYGGALGSFMSYP